MQQKFKGRPPRLPIIFQQREAPLYFITINTLHHKKILANQIILDAFIAYAEKNADAGRVIGKFVIMPDHIHFFTCIKDSDHLTTFVRLMKQHLSISLKSNEAIKFKWQPGFFDHLIRNSESYSEKWNYVHDNPVRAQLVDSVDKWPWQGEVVEIHRW